MSFSGISIKKSLIVFRERVAVLRVNSWHENKANGSLQAQGTYIKGDAANLNEREALGRRREQAE